MARGGRGGRWPISSRRPDRTSTWLQRDRGLQRLPRRAACARDPAARRPPSRAASTAGRGRRRRWACRRRWSCRRGGRLGAARCSPTTCCTAPGSDSRAWRGRAGGLRAASAVWITTTCCGAIRSKRAGEQAAVAEGVLGEVGGEGRRDGVGALEIGRLARQQVQGHQVGDHHGVGVGRGVVVGGAHAHDDVGRVVGGEGVAAAVGDPVVRARAWRTSARRRRDRPDRWSPDRGAAPPRSCWRSRWRWPAPWPGRRDRSGRGGRPSPCAGRRSRRRSAAAFSQSGRSNTRAAWASAAIIRPFQSASTLSSQPGRMRLARRASSLLRMCGERLLLGGRAQVGVAQAVEDGVAFPVAGVRHVVDVGEHLGVGLAQHLLDLGLRPDVELAFLAFASRHRARRRSRRPRRSSRAAASRPSPRCARA